MLKKRREGRMEKWTTWEELLLAFAVNRHGTKSWDSIAVEVQNRMGSSSNCSSICLTGSNCKKKYYELERRFTSVGSMGMGQRPSDVVDSVEIPIPWLDQLRKLRVDELRRELQRYDLSIVSLQSKVKKLKEEREKSLKESEKQIPDFDNKETQPNKIEEKLKTDESDRETESFNESNSTGRRSEIGKTDPETLAGETAPPAVSGDSPEFHESVAESRENSDVQSSASLSKRSCRKKEGSGMSSPGNDDVLPVGNDVADKSADPLTSFIEILRSHQHGSVFQRRLECQQTPEYEKLIRQHIDLGTVRTRLEEGLYSDRSLQFFRDLLLLTTNATVFFPVASPESSAAISLRSFISHELSKSFSKPSSPQTQQAPPPLSPLPEIVPDSPVPLPENPLLRTCSTRGSTSTKDLPTNFVVKNQETNDDDKPNNATNSKDLVPSSTASLAPVRKKRTRERCVAARVVPTTNIMSSHSNSKKRSASKFLSTPMPVPPGNRTLLDSLKSSMKKGVGESRVVESKKGGRGEGKRESRPRRGSTKKRAEGLTGSATKKKNIGRPLKRAAAPPPEPPKKASRRGKEKVLETEVKAPARKRARR